MRTEYHKIDTVFKRDPANKHKTLIFGDYSNPEFEYLKDCEWEFTEKFDGTNIRVEFNSANVTIKGKTDNAQIHPDLYREIDDRVTAEKLIEIFSGCSPLDNICLYGEGVGSKIQRGGGNYTQGKALVLFDIKVNDIWLHRKDVNEIASKLNVPYVPVIGKGTLSVMVDYCRQGFTSTWSDVNNQFNAEGIVARPTTPLLDRRGKRIITKLKLKDFRHGEQ